LDYPAVIEHSQPGQDSISQVSRPGLVRHFMNCKCFVRYYSLSDLFVIMDESVVVLVKDLGGVGVDDLNSKQTGEEICDI
jgi:hypothetical protein